jgi:hypothetical protein
MREAAAGAGWGKWREILAPTCSGFPRRSRRGGLCWTGMNKPGLSLFLAARPYSVGVFFFREREPIHHRRPRKWPTTDQCPSSSHRRRRRPPPLPHTVSQATLVTGDLPPPPRANPTPPRSSSRLLCRPPVVSHHPRPGATGPPSIAGGHWRSNPSDLNLWADCELGFIIRRLRICLFHSSS